MQTMQPAIRIRDRYEILLMGSCSLDSLESKYDSSDVPILSREQMEELQRIVRCRLATGQRIDLLPDGQTPPLYRLRNYLVTPDKGLFLDLGRTTFGEYLLTNVQHPEWRQMYGDVVMSDALAISAAVVTSDRFIFWGRRSRATADGRSDYHILPSGHPQPPESIVDSLYQELVAETGITRNEVMCAICTGLIRTLWNGKPELTFHLESSVPFKNALERPRSESWEFDQISGIAWAPEKVSEWLQEYVQVVAPPGHAAVLLAGKNAFGDDWYRSTVRDLLP